MLCVVFCFHFLKLQIQYHSVNITLLQSQLFMGNQFIKDQNIELQLIINKTIFAPGELITGSIYLQVKDYSLYGDLILRLEAYEQIQFYFKQHLCYGKKHIEQMSRIYTSQFSIASYINGIYKGFYRYSFQVKIPQNFGGSLYFSDKQYLKYRLSAYIQSTSTKLTDQYFHQEICIKQPFRRLKGPQILQQTFSPNYWWVLFSLGTIRLKTIISSNYVQQGQSFKIQCFIDTSRTSKKLQKFQILFQQQKIMVYQKFTQKQIVLNLYEETMDKQQVQKQFYKIQRTIQTPKQILSTAFGQKIARLYVISFVCYFQCSGNIVQQFPIHVFSSNSERVLTLQRNKCMKRLKGTKFQLVKGKFRQYQKPKSSMKYNNDLKTQKQMIQILQKVNEKAVARISQSAQTNRRIKIRKDIL